MDEESRGWRTLPPPLVLGLGLAVVELAVTAVAIHVGKYGPPLWVSLANLGIGAAASALCASGAAELAQRHTGTQRAGLQIAAAAWFAGLALQLLWLGVSVFRRYPWSATDEMWIAVEHYSWFAAELSPIIGWAVAAARRHRTLAGAGVVIAVMSHPPPFVIDAIWTRLALDYQNRTLGHCVLSLLGLVLIAVIAVTLAPATTMPAPGRAAVGLRRAAAALRIRLIAVIAGTLTTMAALTNLGHGAFAVYKFMLVGGAAINAGAFSWLAFGLLDAARDGALARARLVIAGATALWCSAVAVAQLMFGYAAMYGTGDGWTRGQVDVLALGAPLVSLLGVWILAAELGPIVAAHRLCPPGEDAPAGPFAGFTARHREEQLRRDPTGRLVWIVLLMLTSVVIQAWLLPKADTRSTTEWLLIMTGGCSVVALTMIARLCSTAAEAFDREPGLPSARVIGAE
jgi:hypothetical protein